MIYYHYVSSTFFQNSSKSTYKVCIQLSFFHHHRSHKLAIIPPDWICETHRCQKTRPTFNVSWFRIGLTNQSIPSLIPPFATDGRHGRRKNPRCFRAQQRAGSPHVPTTSREHLWPATLQWKGCFFGKDNHLQWGTGVSNDLVKTCLIVFHRIKQVTTHFQFPSVGLKPILTGINLHHRPWFFFNANLIYFNILI